MVHNDERRARASASEQWERNPAGTTLVSHRRGSPEFYEEMRTTRYRLQPWHPALLQEFGFVGSVLEIGCGAGTDNAFIGRSADRVVGVDLALEGAWLTDTLRRSESRSGGAMVADGEQLPFADGSFDAIYSFGVIHHTDHPGAVAAEMLRVLRPGGRLLVAVYHRWSFFTLMKVYGWLRSGRREPWRDYLALIEAGAEELDDRPVVNLYSRARARKLFNEFVGVRTTIRHYGVDDAPIFRRVPTWLREPMARLGGWYVVVTGTRPRPDSS